MLQSSQNPRASILQLLKEGGALSTSQLAQALNFHPISIRQHLMTLESEGYVVYHRIKNPRGRPTKMYELTDIGHSLFPTDYASFTLKLLKSIERLDGEERLIQHFQNIMESILSDEKEKVEGLPLNEKVQALSEQLNQAGYMVVWEENAEGFVIKLHNCPIGKVADEYPQICDQEQYQMEKLLGTQVERRCHKIKGDCLCSYQIDRTQ